MRYAEGKTNSEAAETAEVRIGLAEEIVSVLIAAAFVWIKSFLEEVVMELVFDVVGIRMDSVVGMESVPAVVTRVGMDLLSVELVEMVPVCREVAAGDLSIATAGVLMEVEEVIEATMALVE